MAMATYHVPAAAHEDYPAISVLAEVLNARPSGRLYKALVDAKKASSSYAFAYRFREPGVLLAAATVRKEQSLEEAREQDRFEVHVPIYVLGIGLEPGPFGGRFLAPRRRRGQLRFRHDAFCRFSVFLGSFRLVGPERPKKSGGDWPQGLLFAQIRHLTYHAGEPKSGACHRLRARTNVLKPWRRRPKKANFVGHQSLKLAAESNEDAVDSTSF